MTIETITIDNAVHLMVNGFSLQTYPTPVSAGVAKQVLVDLINDNKLSVGETHDRPDSDGKRSSALVVQITIIK